MSDTNVHIVAQKLHDYETAAEPPATTLYGRTDSGDNIIVSVWTDPLHVEVITKRLNQSGWEPPLQLTKVVQP